MESIDNKFLWDITVCAACQCLWSHVNHKVTLLQAQEPGKCGAIAEAETKLATLLEDIPKRDQDLL
eukprot:scaffold30076_cov76-Attheya_sp.AAC.2